VIELHGELYATATEAAAALREAGQDVSDARVRDWKRRGLITPAAHLDGRPHYRMRDVWRVERDLRERDNPATRGAGRRRARATPTAKVDG
jgi:hypothetical protein